jgi:acetyltransferase-like isoleucine patch superfamily enzyme
MASSLYLLIGTGFRRYLLQAGMNLLPFSSWRIQLLRVCGVRVGRGCYVGFNVIPDTNYPHRISIGNNVTISHNCFLIAHTQTPVSCSLSRVYNQIGSIQIGDGAWIGVNTTILPDVYIGENCFIGAGSVVTKSTSPNSLCAGNPCKFIKTLRP